MNSKWLVINGILWNGLQLIVNQSFSFVVKLILAKILFPEEFGIIGMATVFTGLVQVVNELGIGAALVQRKEKDLTDAHYHTAFWSGVLWSVLLFLIVAFVVAPFASHFYNEPILQSLIPVIAIGILLSPINLVNKAQLTKKMDFKRIARAENIATIIAGLIALMLAFYGAGVWSLAFNSTAIVLFAIPFYFNATGWRPKLVWKKKAFFDVFGFGIYTTGTNITNYFINNVDYLLIGKLISAHALGVYTLAFVLTDTFKSRLSSVVNTVMYPLYANMQTDKEAAKKVYIKVVEYNCIVVYPFMLFLVFLGDPFILEVFGDKWEEALLPLKLLAIAVMVQMLVYSNTVLIRGMGRPDFELKLQLFKAMIYIPSLIFGIYYNGIIGASWAVLTNRVLAVVITNFTFKKLNISFKINDIFLMTKVPFLASVVTGCVVFLVYDVFKMNSAVSTATLIFAYATVILFYKKTELLHLMEARKRKL